MDRRNARIQEIEAYEEAKWVVYKPGKVNKEWDPF